MMERLQLREQDCSSVSPHLPPLSPRSSAKSLLSALTGRYSASYTVTPRSRRFSKGRNEGDNVGDKNVIRSKTYTPIRAPLGESPAVDIPSNSESSSAPWRNSPRPSLASSSNSSLLSWNSTAAVTSPLSRSLSPSPTPSLKIRLSPPTTLPFQMIRSNSYCGTVPNNDEYSPISSYGGSFQSLRGDSTPSWSSMNTSADVIYHGSSCPSGAPECSKIPDDVVRRSGLEEWILCTVKMPTNNKRVTTMSNLTLKDNVAQYHKWLSDTPSNKSARLAKSRNSFRFGKNKSSSTSRASTSTGKTVPVRGHSSVEELERKQGEVLRLLAFFENALEKKIPDYFVGLATMILENVILLSRDVDQMVPNSNSSEVSSLMARLNQSVAELVLWNDQFHLYGDDKHNVQSIESITSNVKQAVKDLVEFAINKENQNVSNFFNSSSNAASHNESNGPLCIQDSPQTRKKLNGSRNSHVHGSMPEIPSYGNGYFEQNSSQSSSCDPLSPPSKLVHSISSDSILDSKDGVTALPNKHSIYVEDNDSKSSFDDSAPPIPPKKSGRQRHLLTTSSNDYDPSTLKQISPVNSSFCDVTFPRHSTGSLTSCSTPHSLGQVSPATSQDSMTRKSLNHSLEERASYSSARSSEASPLHSADLTSMLSQNCGLPPIRKFCPDNSFSSLDSPLLHTTNEPRVTSSFSSSYSCSMVTSKSYISQIEQSYNEGNRITHNIDSLKCSRPISSSSSQMTFSSNQQHLDIHRNSRSSTCSSSSRSSGSEGESNSISVSVPPPIPKKKRGFSSSSERAPSHYDNVDGPISSTESVEFRQKLSSLGKSELCRVQALSSISCSTTSSSTSGLGSSKSSMTSCDSNNGSSPATNSTVHRRIHETLVTEGNRVRTGEKPPLPLKQKHIIEYMQIFKDYQMPDKEWFSHRRSQQMVTSYKTCSVNYLGDEFKELDLLDNLCQSSRFSLPSTNFHLPPALPPKRKSKTNDSFHLYNEGFQTDNTPPSSYRTGDACTTCSCQNKETPILLISSQPQTIKASRDVEYEAKEPITPNHSSYPLCSTSTSRLTKECEPVNFSSNADVSKKAVEVEQEERNLLDLLNVDDEIVFKDNSDDSDVKAGAPDALLVYATYSKNGPYLEAFLTTYRTFMSPAEVISKLFYRYYKFIYSPNPDHQKAAKNAFSLLVRAVHDLVVPELTEALLKDLAEFEYNLLAKGDLKLGLYFRKKLSEKLDLRKRHREQFEFSGHYITIKDNHQHTMLEFKSQDVADQMTLLDSELFSKVGIPELLHFSRDQNEEQCPNLKVFAMQINNMSSWVETQILRSCPPDREKYYKKFIKIMKHLRKVNNNFNSCIAILSGLESAAVCRLDWPKTCTDTLKEYRDLFGFERSYRAYRQALAETKPPCIPHLGIILQDLTKLHNVNPNNTNGKVNFLKRWLQFNILEDMKRFIPSKYDLPRNETIINFINNFEDCMSEEDLWEMSLSIKSQAKPK